MQKIALLFFLMLFMSTCQKDSDNTPPPPDVIIKGVVVDILQQKGIEGVNIYVNRLDFDGLNATVTTIDQTQTDGEGKFEMKNVASCGSCILKISYIPIGYQEGVRINGDDEGCTSSHGLGEEILGYNLDYSLSHSVENKIELMPQTYATIVRPILTPEMKQDTLDLSIGNLCTAADCSNFLCNHVSSHVIFKMQNINYWNNLAEIGYLSVGNKVDVAYKVKNGVVKKSGTFTVECAIGDTTDIVLPLGP